MTKKRLLLAVIILHTIALTVSVLVMLTTSSNVTKANFYRIHEGTTREEVEQIFGVKGISQSPKEDALVAWVADDGAVVYVRFLDGCVVRKTWHDSEETSFKKIRRWLHLP
jgi:hypothetical protein